MCLSRRRKWICVFACVFAGCGARTQLEGFTSEVSCPSTPPTCIARSKWCEPSKLVDASCDVASRTWSCPAGSGVYRRSETSGVCLPFANQPGISSINGWGLSGFSRLPTDDGRCLWVADSVTYTNGSTARNVAFEAEPNLPFGACPDVSAAEPRAITSASATLSVLVQINGGYRLGSTTHVLYRLFQQNPSSTVGVTEAGGGIASFDTASMRVNIPEPSPIGTWGLDLDLGDAHYPMGDGAHELVWGCGQTGSYLTQSCRVARVDANDSVELLSKSGDWIASVRATDGAIEFESGTWQSSVTANQTGFEHVYIADYGSSLLSQSAPTLLGPWVETAGRGACELPASDTHAFCAGPIVQSDLIDPTRSGELPVTYAVGTTNPSTTGDVRAYWPRLTWLH